MIQLVSWDAQISKVHSNFSWLVLTYISNIDKLHLDLFYLHSTFAHWWVTDRIEIDLTFQRDGKPVHEVTAENHTSSDSRHILGELTKSN